MKDLSQERIKLLAAGNGWSLARAEGFIDGESFRRRGASPSKYSQIGIDDYCLGFRAGYYERDNSMQPRPGKRAFPVLLRPSAGRS